MRELLHDSATDKAWQWRRTPRHLTLLARAHMRARNWGVRELFMHCLTENAAMMRLACRPN